MIERQKFKTTKMAISEAELIMLGNESGLISQKDLIKTRYALAEALREFDKTCQKHGFVSTPPRADI